MPLVIGTRGKQMILVRLEMSSEIGPHFVEFDRNWQFRQDTRIH